MFSGNVTDLFKDLVRIGGKPPKNRTGKKVVAEKIDIAKKTGVLSLQEHGLEEVPAQVFDLTNLRTLDISKNKLATAGGDRLVKLSSLKTLNLDSNKLTRGSLSALANLNKLQNLSAGGNQLGQARNKSPKAGNKNTPQPDPLPLLPRSLKHVKLDSNWFTSVPPQICNPNLTRLEKLDMSFNSLAALPASIGQLVALVEVNLDSNQLPSLPDEIGKLKKLKSLSLRNNEIKVSSTNFSSKNPQPLPHSLFTDTAVVDLNLEGNNLTNTQLNLFEGFPKFLERREQIKTKGIYGGALTNLSVCGLD